MEATDDEAATAAAAGNGDNRPLQESAANMSTVACGDGGEAPASGAQSADGKAQATKRQRMTSPTPLKDYSEVGGVGQGGEEEGAVAVAMEEEQEEEKETEEEMETEEEEEVDPRKISIYAEAGGITYAFILVQETSAIPTPALPAIVVPAPLQVTPVAATAATHPTVSVDICPICREPLSQGELSELECCHKYHLSCIETWVQHNRGQLQEPNCPACRRKVGEEWFERLHGICGDETCDVEPEIICHGCRLEYCKQHAGFLPEYTLTAENPARPWYCSDDCTFLFSTKNFIGNGTGRRGGGGGGGEGPRKKGKTRGRGGGWGSPSPRTTPLDVSHQRSVGA